MPPSQSSRPLTPHAEEWIAKQKAAEQEAIQRNDGLRIARERVQRDGRVPATYCMACGARDPQYHQLCGFASWHIARPWPEED